MRRRSERILAVPAVLAIIVALSGCGNPREPSAPGTELQPGWNALGEVPWSSNLRGQNAFWTGAELVVAGGYDHMDESKVAFATSTYSFSLETMQWRELAQLVVPGYDGVIDATGAWVGSSWMGLAYPCRSGPTPSQFAVDNCDPSPVGLRWTEDTGWAVGPEAVPSAAVATDRVTSLSLIGVSGSTLMLAALGGTLIIDTSLADPTAWIFTPWPGDLGVVYPGAACLVDGQILVLTTDLPPEAADQNFGVPQNVSVTVLSPEGLAARGSQDFGERQEQPATQCLPDRALLFQTSTGEIGTPIQRVTPEGVTPWAGRTTGPGSAFVGDGVDVGTGVFAGGPLGSTYTEQVKGEITQLAPISFLTLHVWTGKTLLVVTRASSQLMALLPTPSWEASSEYLFPETVDE